MRVSARTTRRGDRRAFWWRCDDAAPPRTGCVASATAVRMTTRQRQRQRRCQSQYHRKNLHLQQHPSQHPSQHQHRRQSQTVAAGRRTAHQRPRGPTAAAAAQSRIRCAQRCEAARVGSRADASAAGTFRCGGSGVAEGEWRWDGIKVRVRWRDRTWCVIPTKLKTSQCISENSRDGQSVHKKRPRVYYMICKGQFEAKS